MSNEIDIGTKVNTPYGSGIVMSVGDRFWVSLIEGVRLSDGQLINSVPVSKEDVEKVNTSVKKFSMFDRHSEMEE
jgi:hypothetical protein